MPIVLRLGAPGVGQFYRLAIDLDGAGHANQRAEQGEQELALALAIKAAKTHDLTRLDVEIDVVQLAGP